MGLKNLRIVKIRWKK